MAKKKKMYNASLLIVEEPGGIKLFPNMKYILSGELRTGYSSYHKIGYWRVYGKGTSGGRVRIQLEDLYVRVSFGCWKWTGNGYVFEPNSIEDWVSLQAGSDWVDISFPTQIWKGEWTTPGDLSVHHVSSGFIALSYISKEGNSPPPFPYDPNNPNPPQPPPQGVGNLYCKVSGEIRQAKQLYTKQNGVIVPVKTIGR